ncbi:hypothetical protein ALC53_12500, partial [Atta colombica]
IPVVFLGRDKFDFPCNIRLTDLRFHISLDIDLLIGAELFWNLICVGQIKSSDKHSTLYLHKQTMEENICERHFLDNVSQNSQDRYYELIIVIFGIASASFLIIRCLKHLVEQHARQFTRGSACVLRDIYVDDSKWTSNCPELLKIDNHNRVPVIIRDNVADSCISRHAVELESCSILFGLLGSVIVIAKLILQSGLNPCDLINTERWWNGFPPEFLKWDEKHWPPIFTNLDNDLPAQRKIRVAASISHSCIVDDLLNIYHKICIIMYCLRLSKAHRAYVVSDFVSLTETSVLLSTVHGIIQKCIICFRLNLLPASRVNVSRPFSHCNVDYVGPLLFRERKRRNAQSYKSYVSLFVCFATKANHLELNIKDFLHELEISWCFISPNAPHFEGLWKATVKSAKYYMIWIVGKALLLSADPNDLAYLSPEYFLMHSNQPCSKCKISGMKATEFRQFLLYTGPVTSVFNFTDHALKKFVIRSENLYGPTFLYNMHTLIYLINDVRLRFSNRNESNLHGQYYLVENKFLQIHDSCNIVFLSSALDIFKCSELSSRIFSININKVQNVITCLSRIIYL